MNKAEFTTELAERCDITKKDAGRVIDAFTSIVQGAVADGEKVFLVGFGSWEARSRKEREGRNPKTNEKITIPATKVPTFTPGKVFKKEVAENA